MSISHFLCQNLGMKRIYDNLYLSIDDRDIIDELNRLEEEENGISESIHELSAELSSAGFTKHAIESIFADAIK